MALMLILLLIGIPKWLIILLWINLAVALLGALFLSLIASSVDITTFLDDGAQTAEEDEISAQAERGENIAWLHMVIMLILGIPAIPIILVYHAYIDKKLAKLELKE